MHNEILRVSSWTGRRARKAGLDRVFAARDAADKLHLYLVGYGRTMFVGHLALPLPEGARATREGAADVREAAAFAAR